MMGCVGVFLHFTMMIRKINEMNGAVNIKKSHHRGGIGFTSLMLCRALREIRSVVD